METQEKMNIIFSKWMDKTFGVLQFVYAERGDGDFFIQDENKTIGLLKNSEIRLFYPRLFQHVINTFGNELGNSLLLRYFQRLFPYREINSIFYGVFQVQI